MDVLRDLLADIRAKKQKLEQTIDELHPTEMGAGKLLRAASRHWHSAQEICDVAYNDQTVYDLVSEWVDCHVEYEYMITQDPEVYDEIRRDRFRRALDDAKHWKI